MRGALELVGGRGKYERPTGIDHNLLAAAAASASASAATAATAAVAAGLIPAVLKRHADSGTSAASAAPAPECGGRPHHLRPGP